MGSPGDRPTHRLVELHLLLQVQADDAVVVVDPVTVEVIHLGCNQDQDIDQCTLDCKQTAVSLAQL